MQTTNFLYSKDRQLGLITFYASGISCDMGWKLQELFHHEDKTILQETNLSAGFLLLSLPSI